MRQRLLAVLTRARRPYLLPVLAVLAVIAILMLGTMALATRSGVDPARPSSSPTVAAAAADEGARPSTAGSPGGSPTRTAVRRSPGPGAPTYGIGGTQAARPTSSAPAQPRTGSGHSAPATKTSATRTKTPAPPPSSAPAPSPSPSPSPSPTKTCKLPNPLQPGQCLLG